MSALSSSGQAFHGHEGVPTFMLIVTRFRRALILFLLLERLFAHYSALVFLSIWRCRLYRGAMIALMKMIDNIEKAESKTQPDKAFTYQL